MFLKNWSLIAITLGFIVACQKPDSRSVAPSTNSSKPPSFAGDQARVADLNRETRDDQPRTSDEPLRKQARSSSQDLLQTPLLFKVTPRGGGPASYIFGSMHLEISANELPYYLLELFDRADVNAFEVDLYDDFIKTQKFLENVNDINLLLQLNPNAKRNNLTARQIDRLASIGVPKTLAAILPPDGCDLIQLVHAYTQRSFKSMDNELSVRAVNKGKKIIALEDENVRAAANKYAAQFGQNMTQRCTTMDYVNNPEKISLYDEHLDTVKAEYVSANPEQWLNDPNFKEDGNLVFRNHHWLGTLNTLLRQKSAFVTVGANHLRGANGLVQLLFAAGFNVEPVRSSDIAIDI